jgi:hypothetical protein
VPRARLELPVRAARSLPTFFGRAGLEEGDAGYFLAGTYAINAARPEMLQRGPARWHPREVDFLADSVLQRIQPGE